MFQSKRGDRIFRDKLKVAEGKEGKEKHVAEFLIGSWLYTASHGVIADKIAAIKYLRRAVKGGNESARKKLANIVRHWLKPMAREELEPRAKKDELSHKKRVVAAQYLLGRCYKDGTGAPIKWKLAAKWLEKASEQEKLLGEVEDKEESAALLLAQMYRQGENGVALDLDCALFWFKKVAKKGDKNVIVHIEQVQSLLDKRRAVPHVGTNSSFVDCIFEGRATLGDDRRLDEWHLDEFYIRLINVMSDVCELIFFLSLLSLHVDSGVLGQQRAFYYTQLALGIATKFCKNPKSKAGYMVALKYYYKKGYLDEFQYQELKGVSTLELVEHAGFMKDIKRMLEKSKRRLNGTIAMVSENLETLDKNIRIVREDLQSTKTQMAQKILIKQGIDVICAVLNVFTLGFGGSIVQGLMGFDKIIGRIVDFGDSSHIQEIVCKHGGVEGEEEFKGGVEVAAQHMKDMGDSYTDSRLEKKLRASNSPLLLLGIVSKMRENSGYCSVPTAPIADPPVTRTSPIITEVTEENKPAADSDPQVDLEERVARCHHEVCGTDNCTQEEEGGVMSQMKHVEGQLGLDGSGLKRAHQRVRALEEELGLHLPAEPSRPPTLVQRVSRCEGRDHASSDSHLLLVSRIELLETKWEMPGSGKKLVERVGELEEELDLVEWWLPE